MLTDAQVVALRAKIFLDPTAAAFIAARNAGGLVTYLNTASTFYAWKTSVRIDEIGDAINAAELVGLTALNLQRLQAISDYSNGMINPSRQDRRDAFDQIFSAAGGTITRPALAALWRLLATNAERMLAAGTGTLAQPGLFTFQGTIENSDGEKLTFKSDGTVRTAGG